MWDYYRPILGFSLTVYLQPMLLVVTVVSALVHIYSTNGYLGDDPHLPRFMSYLSLFTLLMLSSCH